MQRTALVLIGVAAIAAIALVAFNPWAADEGPRESDARSQRSAETASPPVVDASANAEVQRTPGEAIAPAIDLSACDRDLDLFGVVVDEADAPVAGASVASVTYPSRRTQILDEAHAREVAAESARSGADGSFALRLRRGDLRTLRVTAPGFGESVVADCQAGERVRVVMAPAAALEVAAETEQGEPIEGVRIGVCRRQVVSSIEERRGTTDAAGRVRFDDLAPGKVIVRAEHAVFGTPEAQVVALGRGEAPASVTMVLSEGSAVTGRVVDADTGAPIRGARVGIGSALEREASTDDHGGYRLPGWTAVDLDKIYARADGYGGVAKALVVGWPIDFALHRGDELRGRLLGADGRPIAGTPVFVAASFFAGLSQLDNAEATTDGDGRFAIASLRHDVPHVLVAHPAGHGRFLLDVPPRRDAPGTIDVGDLVLPPPLAVEGRVVDALDAPQPGLQVTIEGWNADRMHLRPGAEPAAPYWYGGTESRRTDDLGRFRFPDQSPGSYVLRLEAAGLAPMTQTLELTAGGDATGIVFRIAGGASLRVRVVTQDAAPLADAVVFVSGSVTEQQRTDEDGLAVFRGLADEEYRIFITHRSGADAPEVRARPSPDEVRIVALEPAPLEGRVTDAGGAPLPDLYISVDQPRSERPWTDADGRFATRAWRGVPVDVVVNGRRREFDARGGESWVPTAWRAKLAGVVPPATDLVLVAREVPLDRSIELEVVGPDGRPVAGAGVMCRSMEGLWGRGTVSDASGRARFDGLEDAPHVFHARPSDAGKKEGLVSSESIEARPGGAPIRLALRPGVQLTVRVLDAEGHAVPDARVIVDQPATDLSRDGMTDSAGRFEAWMPAGATFPVLAMWKAPNGAEQRAYLAKATAGAEIVMKLVP